MPAPGELDEDSRIVDLTEVPQPRPVVLACTGPAWVVGPDPIVRPQPDFADSKSAKAGVTKRFASRNLTPEDLLLSEIGEFVEQWLPQHLEPLTEDDSPDPIDWVESTNFPRWRKDELIRAIEGLEHDGLRHKDSYVKSFIKREQYPDWKYPRPINSRSDRFKVYCGPHFRLIEKKLFALDWFIKKIPVSDRPEYIFKRVFAPDGIFIATDYTSFEALFRARLMEEVEMRLYRYMTQNTEAGRRWFSTIHDVLTGDNLCYFRSFMVETVARRMSGEMCTSLGNSFSNLMFMLFACHKYGSKAVGVVEGDDGLFRIDGPVPTTEFFERLGLKIKLEVHEKLTQASFCGLVFDPEDLVNVRDPRDVLADFAWVESRYARSKRSKMLTLLRCKALSLAHQYPGCPIIGHLARYGLRMTRSHDVRHMISESHAFGFWERETLIQCVGKPIPWREPPIKTRVLVAEMYGISIGSQIEIETMFDSKDDLLPFSADLDVPKAWIDFGFGYTIWLPPTAPHTFSGPQPGDTVGPSSRQ